MTVTDISLFVVFFALNSDWLILLEACNQLRLLLLESWNPLRSESRKSFPRFLLTTWRPLSIGSLG